MERQRHPMTDWRWIMMIAAAAMMLVTATACKRSQGEPYRGSIDEARTWVGFLQKIDQALPQKDLSTAERAWNDGYVTALGSRRWEGLVDIGEAAIRISRVSAYRKIAEARARQAYLTAFFRARDHGSLEGMLRTAEEFAALGDREVTNQILRVAEHLASQLGDRQALDHVRTIEGQFIAGFPMAERSE